MALKKCSWRVFSQGSPSIIYTRNSIADSRNTNSTTFSITSYLKIESGSGCRSSYDHAPSLAPLTVIFYHWPAASQFISRRSAARGTAPLSAAGCAEGPCCAPLRVVRGTGAGCGGRKVGCAGPSRGRFVRPARLLSLRFFLPGSLAAPIAPALIMNADFYQQVYASNICILKPPRPPPQPGTRQLSIAKQIRYFHAKVKPPQELRF
jgi:hypothetical protein